ncbi:hypothetical protein BKA70DRAFT_1541177 [Coprinopsis sp. MPI-PUGE-AT-0042]|nr:hypothetical protein BKA70DRAFT_1541177 [Coprinopsis sp. MPI-PUGE-AT-0042]
MAILLDEFGAHRISLDFLDSFDDAGSRSTTAIGKVKHGSTARETRPDASHTPSTLRNEDCALNARPKSTWVDALEIDSKPSPAAGPPLFLDPAPHLTRIMSFEHPLRRYNRKNYVQTHKASKNRPSAPNPTYPNGPPMRPTPKVATPTLTLINGQAQLIYKVTTDNPRAVYPISTHSTVLSSGPAAHRFVSRASTAPPAASVMAPHVHRNVHKAKADATAKRANAGSPYHHHHQMQMLRVGQRDSRIATKARTSAAQLQTQSATSPGTAQPAPTAPLRQAIRWTDKRQSATRTGRTSNTPRAPLLVLSAPPPPRSRSLASSASPMASTASAGLGQRPSTAQVAQQLRLNSLKANQTYATAQTNPYDDEARKAAALAHATASARAAQAAGANGPPAPGTQGAPTSSQQPATGRATPRNLNLVPSGSQVNRLQLRHLRLRELVPWSGYRGCRCKDMKQQQQQQGRWDRLEIGMGLLYYYLEFNTPDCVFRQNCKPGSRLQVCMVDRLRGAYRCVLPIRGKASVTAVIDSDVQSSRLKAASDHSFPSPPSCSILLHLVSLPSALTDGPVSSTQCDQPPCDRSYKTLSPSGRQGRVVETVMFSNANDLKIEGSSLAVAGGDVVYNNIHYHYERPRDVWAILHSIPNFRQIYQDMLSKATKGSGL